MNSSRKPSAILVAQGTPRAVLNTAGIEHVNMLVATISTNCKTLSMEIFNMYIMEHMAGRSRLEAMGGVVDRLRVNTAAIRVPR